MTTDISLGDIQLITFRNALEHYEKYCKEQIEIGGQSHYENQHWVTVRMLRDLDKENYHMSLMVWD